MNKILLYTAIAILAGASLSLFNADIWPLSLLTHFRVQIVVVLMVVLIICIFYKRLTVGLVSALIIGSHLFSIVPLFVPADSLNESGEVTESVTLLHFNTWKNAGLTPRFVETLGELKPDIVFLQECLIMDPDTDTPALKNYQLIFSNIDDKNRGDIVFARNNYAELNQLEAKPSKVLTIEGDFTRSIGIELSVNSPSGRLRILSTHPPAASSPKGNERHKEQLQSVARWVGRSPDASIVIGDLNTTPWSNEFDVLLKSSGLKNSQRGYGVKPTWPAQDPWWFWGLFSIPIDHCLYDERLIVTNREVLASYGSNHRALLVELKF